VNFVALKREKFRKVVHLKYDFVEPADFVDEEDLHSL
jgi:hypothetical protein